MPHRGKIVSWDDEKGFGFIETEANQRVFLHIKSFNHAKRRPRVGDRVKFQISTDAKGRPQANAVRHDGVRFGLPRVSLSAVFALLFLLGMGLATLFKYLPPWVLTLYLATSAVAFLAYVSDKRAARKKRQRIGEVDLHVFSLLGGWPGALLAQKMLRHKTIKREFQLGFWLSVFVNCAALTYFILR